MDNLILKIVTSLSVDEIIVKPYRKTDKAKVKAQKIKKCIYLWKAEMNNRMLNHALYWIGKESKDLKFRKEFSSHHQKISKKVYTIFKGRKDILKCTSQVKMDM